MAHEFQTGRTYNRRRDIHTHFGGQRQGGISTPKDQSFVILFTGKSGAKHGYSDEWTREGIFRYFGEGQKGPMTLRAGNKAIANHGADGKDLLLFETLGKGYVRFRGTFACAGYEIERAPDSAGSQRDAIVFHLVPADETTDQPMQIRASEIASVAEPGLADVRQQALNASGAARRLTPSEARRSYFARNDLIRRYVLARAAGSCECCGKQAPFLSSSGEPYLEPHHIRRLTDGGLDDPRHMAGVCPNCHREIHHGRNGGAVNKRLLDRVQAIEMASAGGAQNGDRGHASDDAIARRQT